MTKRKKKSSKLNEWLVDLAVCAFLAALYGFGFYCGWDKAYKDGVIQADKNSYRYDSVVEELILCKDALKSRRCSEAIVACKQNPNLSRCLDKVFEGEACK